MATVQKVNLSSELQYLNERLRDGRAVLQDQFSMRRIGNPDPGFQPRAINLDEDHVDSLGEIYLAKRVLDPVVLFYVPNEDIYILIDGFHRHAVYKRARQETIPAYVVEGTVEDAIEYSAMANQHAILKRSPEDIKKQVYLLLDIKKWFDAGDRVIGRHVGVGSERVKRHRAAFCKDRGVSFPEMVTTSEGVTRRRRPSITNPALVKISGDRGGYSSKIGGRNVYLGKDLATAKSNYATIMIKRERRRAVLEPRKFFKEWLVSRGLSFDPCLVAQPTYPGIGTAAQGYGRVAIVARLDEPSAIYAAIGRLYALREILGRLGDRLVMVCVCYPDDGPKALVEVARRLGVELLTPDEVVVSIKGDDGQPIEPDADEDGGSEADEQDDQGEAGDESS